MLSKARGSRRPTFGLRDVFTSWAAATAIKSTLLLLTTFIIQSPMCLAAPNVQLSKATEVNNSQLTPNILLIVADDMGYSDVGAFGGEIETPNINELAASGASFSNFHVAPACAMTRAQLLSGHDHHLGGLGTFPKFSTPNQLGKAGYEGFLNQRVATIAEILKPRGYSTLFSGKWHLAIGEAGAPHKRGFDRSFDFTAGNNDHFALNAKPILDGVHLEQVDENFYSSDAITDAILTFITGRKQGTPFFAYLAFTAPHFALQAPDNFISKYAGRYNEGYAVIQQRRLSKMRQRGLITQDLPETHYNELKKRWSALSQHDQRIEARAMEVYAAMIDNMDQNIGRVIQHLKSSGQYENTLVIFMSDNGAAKTSMSTNILRLGANKLAKKLQLSGKSIDNSLDNMGKKHSWIAYGQEWAEVSNTPFRHYKHTTSEGGIRVPLILSGGYLKQVTVVNHHYTSVMDIMPTLLEATHTYYPSKAPNGEVSLPLAGRSLLESLINDTPVHPPGKIDGWELAGDRGLYLAPWKAVYLLSPPGTDSWELYKLDVDPFEQNNLANSYPRELEELEDLWWQYAESVGVVLPEGLNIIKSLISDYPLPKEVDSALRHARTTD